MAALPKTGILPAEYLALDRQAETRSEYIDGEMVAMSDASRWHNLITGNVVGELRQRLKTAPCEVYPSDMRVYTPDTGSYLYPDVVVVCGSPELADARMDILKIHSRKMNLVRNINLRVRADGSVAASASPRVPAAYVDAFVTARADWVRTAQARAAARRDREAAEAPALPP